jgi:hypothetical protein
MNRVNNPARRLATLRAFSGRTALFILAMHIAGCGDKDKEKAQTPPVTPAPQPAQPAPVTPPVPKPEAKPLTSLESLVAPIALYPDPLLAEVLVASTYPLEVVQAARWLETKPDRATVRGKNWDASVVRLTAVPDVVAMMDQHLDWTTQLGDAFLSNPPQLMDAIQALRKRAIDAGFLKDSDLQKVETEKVPAPESGQEQLPAGSVEVTPAVYTKEVVSIKPAKADTLSVPSYNPEVVYSAPMAPPPTTQMYPAAAPAASYYPAYVQPVTTTTTTSSSSDQWMSFGTGAVVGGLLTWGIMEWADDDWDDYHVSHHYGNAVCHGGNCWHGGGGGYYGGGSRYNNTNIDRGDISASRDINVSGNEINVNRDGTFNQNQLSSLKNQTSSRWQPDPSHRRGQDYPLAAQQRMGRAESPALAGSRLSGAQNLPAATRGFAGAADRTAPSRLSSTDVQQRLAAKPGTAESRGRPAPGSRENALEGLRESGQRSNVESRRGGSSQASRQQRETPRTKDRRASASPAAQSQRRAEPAVQRPGNQQQMARQRNEQTQQRLQSQRRQEMSRPNAFDSARDGGRASAFSNRGSASLSRAQQPARQSPSPGGQRGAGAARSRGGRR